ncbi:MULTISPECIES: T9SS type A sorting domain-containing protein [unclassified Polaribacter]|uniref:T9SS type A sorting domain-containing protein n=1 Tax=unclassified Polaribacter TaxID=196858 RepID=UPI0011BF7857|nr:MULTISPECIES: T9SS type A sorting domain-containing protein [unclassified Polaribacter]TXD53132.1 T9SS type A sorting domain-containing protein [Polaribacter sp. IC063]TXD61252.1 T9SS type A sorting domain-containing protein [Polaribacter sp. IC066]
MKTKFLFKLTLFCCLTTFLSQGQTEIDFLFHDSFNYPVSGTSEGLFQISTNQGLGPWYTTAPRTSGNPIQKIEASTTWSLSSNVKVATDNMLDLRSFGENPAIYFPTQTGDFGEVFVSMFIQIDGYSTNYNTQTGYPVFELEGVGTVWARGTADENVEFGITNNSDIATLPAAVQWSGVKFVAGDQFFLVFSFSRNAGVEASKLWINPAVNGVEPTPTVVNNDENTADFSFFKISVISSARSPDMFIDEVRIAKTWNDVAPEQPLPAPVTPGAVATTITTATTPVFPVYESFDNYALNAKLMDDNQRTGKGAWGALTTGIANATVVNSPTWSSVSADTGLNSTGKALTISGSGGPRLYLEFPGQEGAVYSSFLMKVTNMATLDDTPRRLAGFTVLNGDGRHFLRSHIYIKKGATANAYNLAIANNGSTSSATPVFVQDGSMVDVEYNVNDELFIVIQRTAADTSKIWINPSLAGSEPEASQEDPDAATGSIHFLQFDQADSASVPDVTFDEIRVAGTWDEVTKVKHTWTGTTADWGTTSNWDTGIVPNSLGNVVIPSDAGTSPIVGASTGAFAHNFILDPSKDLTITAGGSLQVTGVPPSEFTYNVAIPDDKWHLVASPVIGQAYNDTWVDDNNIASGSTTTTNRGISLYDNATNDPSTNYWSYMQGGTDGTFNKLKGYSLKRDVIAAGTYSFKGTYPKFNYKVGITQASATSNNWNLVGNPYPSYLNIAEFISVNAAKLGLLFRAIYVWDPTAGTSGVYQELTTGYLHPGQAFFVSARFDEHNLDITEALQSAQTGVTFYKNEEKPNFTLQLSSGSESVVTKFVLLENATSGLNPGQDFGMFTGVSSELAVYSHLIEDNTGIAIKTQSLALAASNDLTIAVGVIAKKESELRFTAAQFNLPSDVTVILEDRILNTFTNLSEKDAVYAIKLNKGVNGVGRFFIQTTANSALSLDDAALSNVSMYESNNTLKISGLDETEFKVSLYNLQGSRVFSTEQNNATNAIIDISLPKLATGVYIVQLETQKGKLNKKIILE